MSRKPYSAPVRDQARLETRRRMRAAAHDLFLRHGYVPTTLAQVADAAGVSTRYVQMAFGSKAGLLSEVIEVAVVGDDEQRPLAHRNDWVQMLGAGGGDTVRAFAEIVAAVYERSAELLAVAASGAEADTMLAELRERSHHRRLRDCTAAAERLQADGWLEPPTTAVGAADTIYVLSSPETYLVFRSQRGLPHPRYADWLTDTLTGALRRPPRHP
jgi:AcrR family transcriptional regulator